MKFFVQDSFVLERYVEKLTQMDPSTGMGPLARKEGMAFDAKVLHESFQASVCACVFVRMGRWNKKIWFCFWFYCRRVWLL